MKTFKTFHWTHYYIDIFQAATAAAAAAAAVIKDGKNIGKEKKIKERWKNRTD